MQCLKPIYITKGIDALVYPEGIPVPCGKCVGCIIARRREWTIRLLSEVSYHDRNVFLTLTYDDDHLPSDYGLHKEHLQKFYKRLRYYLGNREIKYYGVGEYGDRTFRPHYHNIIFGLGLQLDDKIIVRQSWPFCDWDNKDISRDAFGTVTRQSIVYCCKYLDKVTSQEALKLNNQAPFRVFSKGIGKQWCDDNADKLAEDLHVSYQGNKLSIPRYWTKRAGIDKSELREAVNLKNRKLNLQLMHLDLTDDEIYKTKDVYTSLNHQVKKDEIAKFKTIAFQAKTNLDSQKKRKI